MIIRALVILTLVAVLLGGSGYFLYETYVKPKKLDREEKIAVATAKPTPPPDPSLPSYTKVKPIIGSDTPEAREALLAFVKEFPDSPKAPEVRAAIGRINVTLFLSPVPLPEKMAYTVQKGDSLSKIATKLKSGAELIYRANNLQTINLKIGQELLVPKLDTAIVIDRSSQKLTVLNGGVFFKEYPIRSLKLSGGHGPVAGETKVKEKEAVKGTARVSFGSKDYEGSERHVILSAGTTIRAVDPDKTGDAAPAGVLLDPADAEEVYFLSTRGTPVTIK